MEAQARVGREGRIGGGPTAFPRTLPRAAAGPERGRGGTRPGWDRSETGAGTGPEQHRDWSGIGAGEGRGQGGAPSQLPPRWGRDRATRFPPPRALSVTACTQSASGCGPPQPMGAGIRRGGRGAGMADLSGGSEAVAVELWPPGEAPPAFQVPRRGHRGRERGRDTFHCRDTFCLGLGHRQRCGSRTFSGQPLPRPLHHHTMKDLSLISNLNLLSFSLYLFLLVLSPQDA